MNCVRMFQITMYFPKFLFILILSNGFPISLCQNNNGFLGTAELIRHKSSRHSRENKIFSDVNNSTTHPLLAKINENLSSETAREFNHILQMDTQNLTDQQKHLLERIVERVARLGGGNIGGRRMATTISGIGTKKSTQPRNESRGNRKASMKKMQAVTKSPTINTPALSTGSHSTVTPITSPVVSSKSTVPQKRPAVTVTKKLSTIKNNRITITTATPSDLTTTTHFQKIHTLQKKIKPTMVSIARINTTEVEFGNINTSSIVDSLSTDHAREDIYVQRRPLPGPSSTVSSSPNVDGLKKKDPAKPTKYHYYPHNQHIYLLPECAIQQVCNAVYVRLNFTQPLCACPSRYRDPCSASINEDDLHTTKLIGDSSKRAITLAKTCESTTEMRECRSPRDWSLLALQNTRTGKSHYLVICRCPDHFILEGPMAHDQPTYASVPGIRVFGMMCVQPMNSHHIQRKPAIQPPSQAPKREPPYYQQHYTNDVSSSMPTNPPKQYYDQQSYPQSQYQANYQYLHRSDTPVTTTIRNVYNNNKNNNNKHHVTFSHQFGDAYGRNSNSEDQIADQTTSDEETVNGGDTKTMPIDISNSDSGNGSNSHYHHGNGDSNVESINNRPIDSNQDTDQHPSTERNHDQTRHKRNVHQFVSQDESMNNRNNYHNEFMPEIPWHEIKQQIGDIDWN